MSDITAILLTNGEPRTVRALDSLERQTLAPTEIIRVGPEVHPFHRAFNTGAKQVNSEFFIQVDSDMVLDEDCVESLRECVTPRVGMVSGLLRDPILTRILGVHLFRSECVASSAYSDSIVPESDFSTAMQASGWHLLCALDLNRPLAERNTFGLHDPGYTPEYTFSKFLVTGSQIRSRGVGRRAQSFLQQLLHSNHRYSMLASVAAARGFTLALENDFERPFPALRESDFLGDFLNHSDELEPIPYIPIDHLSIDNRSLFEEAVELGSELYLRRSPRTLERTMKSLSREAETASLVALTGLCTGLFQHFGATDLRYDYEHFENLLH